MCPLFFFGGSKCYQVHTVHGHTIYGQTLHGYTVFGKQLERGIVKGFTYEDTKEFIEYEKIAKTTLGKCFNSVTGQTCHGLTLFGNTFNNYDDFKITLDQYMSVVIKKIDGEECGLRLGYLSASKPTQHFKLHLEMAINEAKMEGLI